MSSLLCRSLREGEVPWKEPPCRHEPISKKGVGGAVVGAAALVFVGAATKPGKRHGEHLRVELFGDEITLDRVASVAARVDSTRNDGAKWLNATRPIPQQP